MLKINSFGIKNSGYVMANNTSSVKFQSLSRDTFSPSFKGADKTAFDIAFEEGDLEKLKVLRQACIDKGKADKFYETAIKYPGKLGKLIADLDDNDRLPSDYVLIDLFKLDIPYDTKRALSETAILNALDKGDPTLIEVGKRTAKKTALDIAFENGNLEILKVLRQAYIEKGQIKEFYETATKYHDKLDELIADLGDKMVIDIRMLLNAFYSKKGSY